MIQAAFQTTPSLIACLALPRRAKADKGRGQAGQAGCTRAHRVGGGPREGPQQSAPAELTRPAGTSLLGVSESLLSQRLPLTEPTVGWQEDAVHGPASQGTRSVPDLKEPAEEQTQGRGRARSTRHFTWIGSADHTAAQGHSHCYHPRSHK